MIKSSKTVSVSKNETVELMEAYKKYDFLTVSEEKSESFMFEDYKRDILKDYEVDQNDDFIKVHESNEYIPVQKAVVLRKLLSFLLFKYEHSMNESALLRATRNYRILDGLLNSLEETNQRFIEGDELIIVKQSKYGYTKGHSHGRIYNSTVSITQLSRELRYILFKSIYPTNYQFSTCRVEV